MRRIALGVRNYIRAAALSNGGYVISSSFSPLSLFAAGEVGAWYDPSDFSSMYQDSAGTTPVTAVEQPVGKILDKSGRGNHASQATTTKRPVLKIDGNGKYYLLFDGVDDALATSAIDFSATDKMSVWAGVRKLVDTIGVLIETSANFNSNVGSILITTGDNVSVDGYDAAARGTALSAGVTAYKSTLVAPHTAVYTSTHDIAGDLSTIRINALAGTNGTADKGTGNFGNYALYIGGRAGTSLYLSGQVYSLIIRGAASTAAQITNTESWVNGKTGAY